MNNCTDTFRYNLQLHIKMSYPINNLIDFAFHMLLCNMLIMYS